MATEKPRITITLEEHAYEVLRRLAAAGGSSMSKVVAELVDTAVPSLERVVALMEAAASAPHQSREGLRRALEQAEAALVPTLEGLTAQVDMFAREAGKGGPSAVASDEAGAASQRTGRRSARASTPVPVTRGSGPPPGQPKGRGKRVRERVATPEELAKERARIARAKRGRV